MLNSNHDKQSGNELLFLGDKRHGVRAVGGAVGYTQRNQASGGQTNKLG